MTNGEANSKPIKEKLLEVIRRGGTTMRPRWHFVLRAMLLALGVALAAFALLYLVSFTVFSLHETGAWFVPVFGPGGWFALFRSLPWVLIALSVVFVIVLELLVRHYSFAYRAPLLYSILGIVLLAAIGGGVAAPFHRGPFRSARGGQLPFAGPLYQHFGLQRIQDIHHGTIVASLPNGFVMESVRGGTSTVIITPQTRLPFGSAFDPGDLVVVFGGEMGGGTIQALGVREVEE